MPARELPPEDKRQFISDVGEDLVRRHGKKKYYRHEEVRQSVQNAGYRPTAADWAECIFTSPEDFLDAYNAAVWVGDYAAMKAEVLRDLAEGGTFAWPDIDLSWLEWTDIDVSSVFDWFSW